MTRRRPVAGIADVAPESVLLAGAGRAILLQLANPAVGRGVARHSNFAADPLRRLHATLSYVYALTNGTPAQQRLVKARVQRAHLPVKGGPGPRHPAYDAGDPALQLWVAATLYESAMQIYDAVFPALAPDIADAVYRDYAVLGTALGMPGPLWPATRADFCNYWNESLCGLDVDDSVRRVARELLSANNAPPWIKLLMPLVRFLTVGLLPPSVRELYGFPWSPPKDRLLRRICAMASILVRITPVWIRHAPMRHYLKHLA